jgi:drug/metabolite transporter (DMT)-like permease
VRASARYTASPWLLFGETLTLIHIAEMLVGALGGIIVTEARLHESDPVQDIG